MNLIRGISTQQKAVLAKARETYGDLKQILVSNEELCELAAVCAKFPRYDDPRIARAELHSKAIDEVADVLVILDHVVNIFGLSDAEIQTRVSQKIARVNKWLSESTSMEQTIRDRELPQTQKSCQTCTYVRWPMGIPGKPCSHCTSFSEYKNANQCVGCKHTFNWENLRLDGICMKCMREGGSQYTPKIKRGNDLNEAR